MIKSDSIKELATAFAKAQSEIKKAPRKNKNPYFKSSYADLESVWDACRDALAKNGLSITQLLGSSDNKPDLTTILMHSSGEFIQTSAILPIIKQGPQDMGSALTYMKRYSLAAMVGIADSEDDDAEAAMGRGAAKSKESNNDDFKFAPSSEYTLKSGKHAGKRVSQLTKTQIDVWLRVYEAQKAEKMIPPDVERDTQEILYYLDEKKLEAEESPHGK